VGSADLRTENDWAAEAVAARQIILACRQYASDHDDQWPQTLEQLSPAYLPKEMIWNATLGDGNKPGFDYASPSKSTSTDAIVLVSKRIVRHNEYCVGYSDGSVVFKVKPFQSLFSR